MRSLKASIVLSLVFALGTMTIQAQQKPMASPPGTTEVTLKGKKITINYHRPSMKGRKIFGDLVPYNQVWRTGANNATSFTTEADLMFGNVTVPAGSYTLYTLPTEQGWKLIINKQTGQWGTVYKQEEDLARIDLKTTKLRAPVEQFTLTLSGANDTGTLKMEWEATSASVDFKVK
jgi:hypothetical protein